MHLTLTLIPNNRAFEEVVTKSDANKVPIVFAAWYPTTTKITATAAQKRFHYYAESLAIVGGLLERVELKRGVTAAPSRGKGRVIKDRANAFCWRLAGRPAIAAGTDYKLMTRGVGATGGGLLARIYQQHPKDMLAQELYAVDLALHEGSEYLSVEGLEMPRNGKDLRAINALLGFCRAFVHYPGDIRKKPMPLLKIKPAHFFQIPAATSAAQAATSEATASSR